MFYAFGARRGGEDGGACLVAPWRIPPYLVALALCDQEGRRLMPLAGRSQAAVAAQGDAPHELAHALALELLLRVWQRSDDGALARAAGEFSLLLVELPMQTLPEQIPALKSAWLNTETPTPF